MKPTANDLIEAVLAVRPVAPPYPEWQTIFEVMKDAQLNENQAHTRLAALVRAGKVEKRRGPRREGTGGTVTYYHLKNRQP